MPVASTGRSQGRSAPDPFMAFQYVVTLDSEGETVCGFTDVSGLGAETEVETFRAGGLNDGEVQLPGPTKFPARLVLRTGLADQRRLWAWYVDVMKGAIKRRDVTITLKSADGRRSVNWSFRAACPVKWIGPELHSNASAVAFESIELVHRGFLGGAG